MQIAFYETNGEYRTFMSETNFLNDSLISRRDSINLMVMITFDSRTLTTLNKLNRFSKFRKNLILKLSSRFPEIILFNLKSRGMDGYIRYIFDISDILKKYSDSCFAWIFQRKNTFWEEFDERLLNILRIPIFILRNNLIKFSSRVKIFTSGCFKRINIHRLDTIFDNKRFHKSDAQLQILPVLSFEIPLRSGHPLSGHDDYFLRSASVSLVWIPHRRLSDSVCNIRERKKERTKEVGDYSRMRDIFHFYKLLLAESIFSSGKHLPLLNFSLSHVRGIFYLQTILFHSFVSAIPLTTIFLATQRCFVTRET